MSLWDKMASYLQPSDNCCTFTLKTDGRMSNPWVCKAKCNCSERDRQIFLECILSPNKKQHKPYLKLQYDIAAVAPRSYRAQSHVSFWVRHLIVMIRTCPSFRLFEEWMVLTVWFLIKNLRHQGNHQSYTVHACSTRPWWFLSQTIPWCTQIIYKVKASADACLSGSHGFWNIKAGSHSEKKGLHGSAEKKGRCACNDLKGGCDHAVSLDQPELAASLCCCSGRKNSVLQNQLLMPPSSFCANVPPVHLLIWGV